ncbi:MAG: hypothetical protein AABZ15_11825, partial [Nitrospirota bacterium]
MVKETIMKVDMDQVFKELDGKVIKDGGAELKLENLAVRALNAPSSKVGPDGRIIQIGAEEKIARFNLSRKVFSGGEVDLTTDECVLIKKCIDAAY